MFLTRLPIWNSYELVKAAIHYNGPNLATYFYSKHENYRRKRKNKSDHSTSNCTSDDTFKAKKKKNVQENLFLQTIPKAKKKKHVQENVFLQTIPIGSFWQHVPTECEIEPTVIPLERMKLFWYHAAYVWGSHHSNQWIERKDVLKLGMGKGHSMRGSLIPRPSTVLPFLHPFRIHQQIQYQTV